MTVALSTGGVYQTHDGGSLLGAAQPRDPGGVPARGPAVPRVRPVRAQGHPSPRPTRRGCSLQNHGGVYRSDDEGETWVSIADGLPSDFGFPIVVHPHEPDTVFVFPIGGGDSRFPPEGRPRVWRSRDAGETWEPLGEGLPEAFYAAVMRDAMCADDPRPGGPLLRRPQRQRLGLSRLRRDLARGRRQPARRDGRAGRRRSSAE